METKDIDNWINSERKKVKEYLKKEGIDSPNIGEVPAFKVSQYFVSS